MTFEMAQKIADAVLYEGYLLYPYHAGSPKNQVRFQFGVVAPRAFAEAEGSESWESQTDCLVEATPTTSIEVRIRALQLQARMVDVVAPGTDDGFAPVERLTTGDVEVVPWDEAVEVQVDEDHVSLDELLHAERVIPFELPGGRDVEHVHDTDGSIAGRIVRTRWPVDGVVRLSATRFDGIVRLRVRVENHSGVLAATADRDEALRRSLLSCHALLAVSHGAFLSLIDPPLQAAAAAAACENLHTWPVLVGEDGRRDMVLSSPIILYDYPQIAPESQTDLFDGTEIDEILMLRIMTLSDEEKRAARATDPRARAIIDAADTMPPEIFDRLHGAIRYLRETPDRTVQEPAPSVESIQPWNPDEPAWPTFSTPPSDDRLEMPASVWEPDARVVPERAAIEIDGMTISKGASVRLRPNRRADSMDVFLAGRLATVEAVFETVDDETHIAVTIDDDPATDLHRAYGRFFYFAPDEVEAVAPAPVPVDGQAGPIMLEPSARTLAKR